MSDKTEKTLLICSGGLDSVCLAYSLAASGKLAFILSFDYGQRHKKELTFARQTAEDLNIPFSISDISALNIPSTGSALTDDNITVPDGHYAADTMKLTIVPNRNVLFLTIAFTIAAARGLNRVSIATHSGDHLIYPDCRPEFLSAFNIMEQLVLGGSVKLIAPYARQKKVDIVRDGAKYQVPFAKTWSCYKGGVIHCGRCGTCVERQKAFHAAGIVDPTKYADSDYWQMTAE